MEIHGRLRRDDAVFVPKELWPHETCNEHAGLGWAATVVSTTQHSTVVRFTYARAANGAVFEDERLLTSALKRLV